MSKKIRKDSGVSLHKTLPKAYTKELVEIRTILEENERTNKANHKDDHNKAANHRVGHNDCQDNNHLDKAKKADIKSCPITQGASTSNNKSTNNKHTNNKHTSSCNSDASSEHGSNSSDRGSNSSDSNKQDNHPKKCSPTKQHEATGSNEHTDSSNNSNKISPKQHASTNSSNGGSSSDHISYKNTRSNNNNNNNEHGSSSESSERSIDSSDGSRNNCDLLTLYVCGAADSTIKAPLVGHLSQYAFVRSSLGSDSFVNEAASIKQDIHLQHSWSIIHCHAFVFLLDDSSIRNKSLLTQLGTAISFGVPVIPIRRIAYRLPAEMLQAYAQVRIVDRQHLLYQHCVSSHHSGDDNSASSFVSSSDDTTDNTADTTTENTDITLHDTLQECYSNARVFLDYCVGDCVQFILEIASSTRTDKQTDISTGGRHSGVVTDGVDATVNIALNGNIESADDKRRGGGQVKVSPFSNNRIMKNDENSDSSLNAVLNGGKKVLPKLPGNTNEQDDKDDVFKEDANYSQLTVRALKANKKHTRLSSARHRPIPNDTKQDVVNNNESLNRFNELPSIPSISCAAEHPEPTIHQHPASPIGELQNQAESIRELQHRSTSADKRRDSGLYPNNNSLRLNHSSHQSAWDLRRRSSIVPIKTTYFVARKSIGFFKPVSFPLSRRPSERLLSSGGGDLCGEDDEAVVGLERLLARARKPSHCNEDVSW